MRIILNTQSNKLMNEFISQTSDDDLYNIINAKVENILFNYIMSNENIDAFVIESTASYAQKAIDIIKRKYSYIPVVVLGILNPEISKADIYIPMKPGDEYNYNDIVISVLKNIKTYKTNFDKLQKISAKITDIIEFGDYKYDPVKRLFYHKDQEIKRLSAKEGGIIEVLSSNFKEIVKKEIILEKVWRKTDYFASRSMDVYITHLRKLFINKNIDLKINNISGVGLILE